MWKRPQEQEFKVVNSTRVIRVIRINFLDWVEVFDPGQTRVRSLFLCPMFRKRVLRLLVIDRSSYKVLNTAQ